MRLIPLLPLLMLPLSIAAHAAPTPPSVDFTHHDWMLACDNTRTCRAAGYQEDTGSNEPVSVLLTRRAGAGAPVSAELMLGQYEETVLPARVRLHIAGVDQGEVPVSGKDGEMTLRPAQIDALLAALAGTGRIEVRGDDGQHWTLSGRGASAVLLKMDEFQGRVGTPGALRRKGTRAESSVLPALPVPVVTLAPLPAARPSDSALAGSAELRAAISAAVGPDDCHLLAPGDSPDPDAAPEPLTITRLGADTLLVSVACWRAAYNEGRGYWVVKDRAPYSPVLVTTVGNEDDGQIISGSHKGRGLGDCWSMNSWGWNGRAFVPTAVSTTGLCRLVAAGGAWTMPTLVTEVKPSR